MPSQNELNRRKVLAGMLALGGCGAVPERPDIAELYAFTHAIPPNERRPIVTIPGMAGSRLRVGRDGPFIWGGPRRLSADPDEPAGAQLLALPIATSDAPLRTLRDEIRPDGVLRSAHISMLGASMEEQVYEGLIDSLNAGGYAFSRSVEEERGRRGRNAGSFEFPYDWRRDIVESAGALDRFVERKADQVARMRRQLYGASVSPEEVRFDFVAHSMGALVLRYWLMYGGRNLPDDGPVPPPDWAGARRAACAIFIAPPFLGSILAFTTLLEGRRLGPLQPWHPPAILGTFPAIYQLMPRDRHDRVRLGGDEGRSPGSIYQSSTWAANRWGLLDPAEEERLAILMPGSDCATRRRRAAAHLHRVLGRARRFHEAIDQPGEPPDADLFLVVGTGLETPAGVVLDAKSRKPARSNFEEGDGVVLRASALSDERQGGHSRTSPRRPVRYRTTLLLPGEHVRITSDPVFTDNLLYWLLDAPRREMPADSEKQGRSATPLRIGSFAPGPVDR